MSMRGRVGKECGKGEWHYKTGVGKWEDEVEENEERRKEGAS